MAKKSRRPDEVEVVDYALGQETEEYIKAKEAEYSNLTWEMIDAAFYSLEEAQEVLGLARTNYVRQLVLQGRLEGVKVALKGYNKWFLDKESVYKYDETKGRRLAVRRYILRIDPELEEQVREALDEIAGEDGYELEFAYQGS